MNSKLKVTIVMICFVCALMSGCLSNNQSIIGTSSTTTAPTTVNNEPSSDISTTVSEIDDSNIEYQVSELKGSIRVPKDYNVYGVSIPYTDEMCASQGIDSQWLKDRFSLVNDQVLIIPSNEQYSSCSIKIHIKIKEKKYENITLSQLSDSDYNQVASTIVKSFDIGDALLDENYKTVEKNGLKFFVFHINDSGYQCRYATIIDGHMIYVYADTGDTPINDEQLSVLNDIALSIKSDL